MNPRVTKLLSIVQEYDPERFQGEPVRSLIWVGMTCSNCKSWEREHEVLGRCNNPYPFLQQIGRSQLFPAGFGCNRWTQNTQTPQES